MSEIYTCMMPSHYGIIKMPRAVKVKKKETKNYIAKKIFGLLALETKYMCTKNLFTEFRRLSGKYLYIEV